MRQVDKKCSQREKEKEKNRAEEEEEGKNQHKHYAKLGLFCDAVRWLLQSIEYIFLAVLSSSLSFSFPTQLGRYCKYDINMKKFLFFVYMTYFPSI